MTRRAATTVALRPMPRYGTLAAMSRRDEHLMADLRPALSGPRPLFLESIAWPAPPMRILMLAPHPDDFDAVAVTLRFFHCRGDPLRVAVVSGGASGVEDSFCVPATPSAKAAIREAEQRASVRMFGLPMRRLSLLRLAEDAAGDPRDDGDNFRRLAAAVAVAHPHLVVLPHGHDTNEGHRRTFQMLLRIRDLSRGSFVMLLLRDPKTIAMRPDLYTVFGHEDAAWKAELLRCHRSQHHRNLLTRGRGFDERILDLNRRIAEELLGVGPFAECLEVMAP